MTLFYRVEQYRLGAQAFYFPGFPGTHDGEKSYKDFMFEKQKSAEKVEEAIRLCCPLVEIDTKVTTFLG